MLYAKVVTSPHAHAEVLNVDLSGAKALAGVKAVWSDPEKKEVNYVSDIVAAVAAETEEIAREAAKKIKVEYKVLSHQVVDSDVQQSKEKQSKRDAGDVDKAFNEGALKTTEGTYGIPVITHCCLEPHGQVTEIRDGELFVWPSTQNVSGYGDKLGEPVDIPQNKVHVECQYMGGGFGSKFGFDSWGSIGAQLAKQAGRPVKLMLERCGARHCGQSAIGLRQNQSWLKRRRDDQGGRD